MEATSVIGAAGYQLRLDNLAKPYRVALVHRYMGRLLCWRLAAYRTPNIAFKFAPFGRWDAPQAARPLKIVRALNG